MERALFLDSSGAIVTDFHPYRNIWAVRVITENPLPGGAYMETVELPVVSIDSSAIYGEHPENVATLTVSSGAALTFFCDSVAGGGDSRGDGSFADPWRSLRTASNFLARNQCVLRKVAPYIQLKVRGVVDYVSNLWSPFTDYGERVIIAGWGGRCDLGGGGYVVRYLFNVRGRGYYYASTVYSNCTIVNGGGESSVAVDCELETGATLLCALNCSGANASGYLNARVCRGGSFGHYVSTYYICSATVSVERAGSAAAALVARSAAVGVSVTAGCSLEGPKAVATGIWCDGSAYLGGCVVDVRAAAQTTVSSQALASAMVVSIYGGGVVVSGGRFTAVAEAVASYSEDRAYAEASATGFPAAAQLTGASVTLIASAGAHFLGGSGSSYEEEQIISGGTTCTEYRTRQYSGGVATSSWSSSRCR